MGKIIFFLSVVWVPLILYPLSGYGQIQETRERPIRMGVGYGLGTQQLFPFNSADYDYSFSSFKILFNYRLSESRVWRFEITAEPGLYHAQHQLLNIHYVQPRHGNDYLEQREWLRKEKVITDYVFELGFIVRHQTFRTLSFFIQGSVGPMYTNRYTERMAKGFAFSDVLTIGFSPEFGNLQLMVRTGTRHVSNFNIKEPNSGYNSVMLEMGIMYNL